MHFTFNGDTYKQVDGVAMGSPLGPVLANVFMVELEEKLIPTLRSKVSLWRRYVDDTFTYIRHNEIENVKEVLNSFHVDIKFTHETEVNNRIAFLDVDISKNSDGTFSTEVHRKMTDTNIYLNWSSFAPETWKIGTLKGLFRRAHLICSTEAGLNKELKHLKYVFTRINNYPSKVVNNALHQVVKTLERERSMETVPQLTSEPSPSNESAEEDDVFPYMTLPYKGQKGEDIIKTLSGHLSKLLPKNVKPRITYKGKKLGSHFAIKDPVPNEHLSDLVYGFYDDKDHKEIHYVGETKVRFGTRVHEHCETDKTSAVYKFKSSKNIQISKDNFKVLESGMSKAVDRKLAEALYIKQLNPTIKVKCFNLKLFN